MNLKKHKPRAAEAEPRGELRNEARERALDLVDRALETGNAAEVRKLMRQAVKLDPDCVDALLMLAKVTRLSAPKYIEKMREAVQAGERTLGQEFFKANRGHFWLVMETRPYMRARFDLGMALGNDGDFAGAIAEFEGMLDLNPRDNQGVRDYLLALYLAMENLDGAARLLRGYGDFGAVFGWGSVFFHLLKDDERKAKKSLFKAMDANRFAPFYFGMKKPSLPGMFTIGSEEEGEYAGVVLAPAWLAHPEIVYWIGLQILEILPKSGGIM